MSPVSFLRDSRQKRSLLIRHASVDFQPPLQPDDTFEWLRRAWTEHDLSLIENLLSHPFITRAYQHDPRLAALCKQAALPLQGQGAAGRRRSGCCHDAVGSTTSVTSSKGNGGRVASRTGRTRTTYRMRRCCT